MDTYSFGDLLIALQTWNDLLITPGISHRRSNCHGLPRSLTIKMASGASHEQDPIMSLTLSPGTLTFIHCSLNMPGLLVPYSLRTDSVSSFNVFPQIYAQLTSSLPLHVDIKDDSTCLSSGKRKSKQTVENRIEIQYMWESWVGLRGE